jgi:hypothetical protein
MSPPGPDAPTVTEHRAWITVAVSSLVIGLVFIAVYVGLQRDPKPFRLPIAVVGNQLASAARAGWGDSVAVTEASSIQDDAMLVRNGDVVGVVGATSPTTLRLEYAGASGLSESGAAQTLVAGLAAHAGATVQAIDIVPLTRYDTRGLSAFYVVFGVTLASFILAQGLLAATRKVRLGAQLLVMTGYTIAIGMTAAAIAGPLYGSLPAAYPLLAVSLILLSGASTFATQALGVWLGAAGIGVAILTLTTIGNATSGATIGYDLLPRWGQAVSGALPAGAAVRAVNDFGYFNGSHVGPSLSVLAIWFVLAIGLVVLRQRLPIRSTSRR